MKVEELEFEEYYITVDNRVLVYDSFSDNSKYHYYFRGIGESERTLSIMTKKGVESLIAKKLPKDELPLYLVM